MCGDLTQGVFPDVRCGWMRQIRLRLHFQVEVTFHLGQISLETEEMEPQQEVQH